MAINYSQVNAEIECGDLTFTSASHFRKSEDNTHRKRPTHRDTSPPKTLHITRMHPSYFPLPTSRFLLPASYFPLPASRFLLHVSILLPTPCCLLPTPYSSQLNLWKSILYVILLSHWFACAWGLLAALSDSKVRQLAPLSLLRLCPSSSSYTATTPPPCRQFLRSHFLLLPTTASSSSPPAPHLLLAPSPPPLLAYRAAGFARWALGSTSSATAPPQPTSPTSTARPLARRTHTSLRPTIVCPTALGSSTR